MSAAGLFELANVPTTTNPSAGAPIRKIAFIYFSFSGVRPADVKAKSRGIQDGKRAFGVQNPLKIPVVVICRGGATCSGVFRFVLKLEDPNGRWANHDQPSRWRAPGFLEGNL